MRSGVGCSGMNNGLLVGFSAIPRLGIRTRGRRSVVAMVQPTTRQVWTCFAAQECVVGGKRREAKEVWRKGNSSTRCVQEGSHVVRRWESSTQWLYSSSSSRLWMEHQLLKASSSSSSSSYLCHHYYFSTPLVSRVLSRNGCLPLPRSRKTTQEEQQHTKKVLHSEDLKFIDWWKQKLDECVKPLTRQMAKRLKDDNLLGLDETLRSGSMKARLNVELLAIKRKFPHEVLLCRVGEFYEAVGYDACMLVEYAGLNPMGGSRSASVPKAGCPLMNLRQALDMLTGQGFSVCIVEEVQGPQTRGQLKERFVAGHAHPGSPYVYGLIGADVDLEFPEPVPVIGISRSAHGYCLILVLEMMRSVSVEDSLTEEAVVAKLRARQCQRLFLHKSLRSDASGVVKWGAGGLLWGECQQKPQEWYENNPVTELLLKVRELFDLDQDECFREIVIPPGERPRPLYVSTASQIGILPTAGVPSLLKVALPPEASHLCIAYLRNLLLHPPPFQVAASIQAACQRLSEITSSIPDFTCVSAAKVMKLIEAKEANHIEFARIRNIAEDIIHMAEDSQLSSVLDLLVHPTWLATGLQINRNQLVEDCKLLASIVVEVLAVDGDPDQIVTTAESIPDEFFRDLEEHWRGRVKRIHAEEEFAAVECTAAKLSDAVVSSFLPIVNCVKAYQKPLGSRYSARKAEIGYSRDNQAVWFKGKNFKPTIWGQMPGESEMKHLTPAFDSKGKKAGEEWWTTGDVEDALIEYKTAVDKVSSKVVEILKDLSDKLKAKMNVLIFISVLSVIAKTLCIHVSEGKRRNWVFPLLTTSRNLTLEDLVHQGDTIKNPEAKKRLHLVDLVPYWKDPTREKAEPNTIVMDYMFLLTGPNGGGKSSILRSVCAAAVLGLSGLMVPARAATIPQLDAIMLRMMSTDSPADNKSSFQMEMSELRTILGEATGRSLVLVDELCRGTEVQKGTFIAASVIESLDRIGCMGILSTHLHDLLDMKLQITNVVQMAMGTKEIDGRLEPTWKLVDGACRQSLAFEVARREGVPENVVQRAEELYKLQSISSTRINIPVSSNTIWVAENEGLNVQNGCSNIEEFHGQKDCKAMPMLNLRKELKLNGHDSQLQSDGIITAKEYTFGPDKKIKDVMVIYENICRRKLLEINHFSTHSGAMQLHCSLVGPRQLPPPLTTKHSCVYMLQRPDGRFYVGQSDDLVGRIIHHRKNLKSNETSFLYVMVANKSVACELETTLINQLPSWGITVVNKGDQNHRHFATAPHIEPPPF